VEEDLKEVEIAPGKGDETWDGMIKIMESLAEGRGTRGKNE